MRSMKGAVWNRSERVLRYIWPERATPVWCYRLEAERCRTLKPIRRLSSHFIIKVATYVNYRKGSHRICWCVASFRLIKWTQKKLDHFLSQTMMSKWNWKTIYSCRNVSLYVEKLKSMKQILVLSTVKEIIRLFSPSLAIAPYPIIGIWAYCCALPCFL